MTKRTPVSKTVRFEVFKRDRFACQYCGRTPPTVVLECDHIVPVSAGGVNEDWNLITACFDCNRGKSDRLLSVVPESLASRASRVQEAEEQLAAYTAMMRGIEERKEAEAWEVIEALFGETTTTHARFNSVRMFVDRLTLHEMLEAARIARAAKPWSEPQRFKYFCGVCWNKIRSFEGD